MIEYVLISKELLPHLASIEAVFYMQWGVHLGIRVNFNGDGGSTMMAENIVIVCNAMNMNRKWSIK